MNEKIEKFPRENLFLSTKLIELFKTLSRKELQGFDDFLQGLYSREKIALESFLYLKQLHPHFTASEKTSWNFAYRTIFKKELSDKKDLKNLQNSFSDLYQYLQEYLLWKKGKEKSFEGELLRLEVLKERKLEKAYRNKIEVLKKRITKDVEKDMWHYLALMRLNTLQYYGTEVERLSIKDDLIIESMNNLDAFYIHAKFRIGAEFINRKNVLQENLSIPLLEEVRQLYQRKEATPIADLYLSIINLRETDKEEDYIVLKEQFMKYRFQNSKDQTIILFYLLNYVIKHTREDEHRYSKEAFKLYKYGLEHQLFTLAGHFPTEPFLNIVNAACVIGSFKWAKNFIEKQGVFLKEEKESTMQLAFARLAFARGNYEEVIELLRSVKFKNVLYAVQTRLLELRSFYKRGAGEEYLLRLCANFEKFLDRNKTFNPQILLGGKNFLKIFRMMLRKKKRKEVNLALGKLKLVVAGDWLIKEIATLPL